MASEDGWPSAAKPELTNVANYTLHCRHYHQYNSSDGTSDTVDIDIMSRHTHAVTSVLKILSFPKNLRFLGK